MFLHFYRRTRLTCFHLFVLCIRKEIPRPRRSVSVSLKQFEKAVKSGYHLVAHARINSSRWLCLLAVMQSYFARPFFVMHVHLGGESTYFALPLPFPLPLVFVADAGDPLASA